MTEAIIMIRTRTTPEASDRSIEPDNGMINAIKIRKVRIEVNCFSEKDQTSEGPKCSMNPLEGISLISALGAREEGRLCIISFLIFV